MGRLWGVLVIRVLRYVLVACVLIGASACADKDTPSVSTAGTGFAAAYKQAEARYAQIAKETSVKATAAEGDEAAALKVYEELAKQVDGVRKQYGDLPTPAKVAPQVSAVVRVLAEQVTLLRRIAPEVQAKDSAAVQAALKALSDSTVALAQARVQLEKAVEACGVDCS